MRCDWWIVGAESGGLPSSTDTGGGGYGGLQRPSQRFTRASSSDRGYGCANTHGAGSGTANASRTRSQRLPENSPTNLITDRRRDRDSALPLPEASNHMPQNAGNDDPLFPSLQTRSVMDPARSFLDAPQCHRPLRC